MSHEINYNSKKGTHSFASHSENAWHGLGQVVDNAMTSQQAIELANLDYEVSKAPIYAGITQEGITNYSEYQERFATYRTDTNEVLGLVGGRYEIVQNKDAFGFFDAIIDSGEAIFETAGVLGKGERIFVTAKLPNDMLIKGEEVNKYIILTNSHNGSSSIIAGFTSIRVVCNNTLQASLRELSNKVSIQHRAGAKEKLSEAYRVMGIASSYMTEVESIFNQMAKTQISDDGLKEYIKEVMKPVYKKDDNIEEVSTRFKNQVESIYEFALSHPTQVTDASRGTMWGAYNSISGYYNYIANFKDKEAKFSSQMFGNANTKISKGFEVALELI
jgi:phage/plasmid-like protein (TIGR03299 family)